MPSLSLGAMRSALLGGSSTAAEGFRKRAVGFERFAAAERTGSAVEQSLDPASVKANTRIVDITDDPGWLAAARWEMAVGYSKLVDPSRQLQLRDIYHSVCEDGYEKDGHSRTVAALTVDPVTRTPEISGAVRLVIGRERRRDSDPLPIDAMNLVTPAGRWPHRRSGRSDAETCELGRFVIPEKYRTAAMRRAGVDAFITGRWSARPDASQTRRVPGSCTR